MARFAPTYSQQLRDAIAEAALVDKLTGPQIVRKLRAGTLPGTTGVEHEGRDVSESAVYRYLRKARESVRERGTDVPRGPSIIERMAAKFDAEAAKTRGTGRIEARADGGAITALSLTKEQERREGLSSVPSRDLLVRTAENLEGPELDEFCAALESALKRANSRRRVASMWPTHETSSPDEATNHRSEAAA